MLGLDQNFRFGTLDGIYLHPATSAGCRCFRTPYPRHRVALQWGEILRLVVGIRVPKGALHDFSHPSDAYACVVVKRGSDVMVGGNCARAGLAWRSTRQSLAKRRIRYRDAPREFTA